MQNYLDKQDKANLTRDLTQKELQSRERWYRMMETNLSDAARWATIYDARCK